MSITMVSILITGLILVIGLILFMVIYSPSRMKDQFKL